MSFETLISTGELGKHLDDPLWAIVDCRFVLADPDKGADEYLCAHIPGAVYAHLERDLTGEVIPGKTGRHPLPGIEAAAVVFSNLGIGSNVQVVVYDDAGGALAAVRLWWMLRWLGHKAVAVLDGGWNQWQCRCKAVENGIRRRQKREFRPSPRPELLVNSEQIEQMRSDSSQKVFDARAPERYRGEIEPIDPVAGHIRGAINAPYDNNLSAQGTMKPVEELRAIYQDLLGEIPASRSAFYCGSGVTAIHDILAIQHAGMGEARLYAGSWSEWITDPDRAVEKGPLPGG